MAQKIVIKVQMAGDKCRSKAMALVAATCGVVSVQLAGDDKSQVVVVGDVDSVKLTNALRRKVGPAQLVEVGDAKKEEEKKKKDEKKDEPNPIYYPGYSYGYPNLHHHMGYYGCPCGCNPHPDSICTIM